MQFLLSGLNFLNVQEATGVWL